MTTPYDPYLNHPDRRSETRHLEENVEPAADFWKNPHSNTDVKNFSPGAEFAPFSASAGFSAASSSVSPAAPYSPKFSREQPPFSSTQHLAKQYLQAQHSGAQYSAKRQAAAHHTTEQSLKTLGTSQYPASLLTPKAGSIPDGLAHESIFPAAGIYCPPWEEAAQNLPTQTLSAPSSAAPGSFAEFSAPNPAKMNRDFFPGATSSGPPFSSSRTPRSAAHTRDSRAERAQSNFFSGKLKFLFAIFAVLMGTFIALNCWQYSATGTIVSDMPPRKVDPIDSKDNPLLNPDLAANNTASAKVFNGNNTSSKASTAAGSDAQIVSDSEGVAPAQFFVYVTGAVKHPGVVSLLTPARVVDAIKAAGGYLQAANLDSLNFAQIITDGQHIHLAYKGENFTPPASAPLAGSSLAGIGGRGQKVSLNTGQPEQLQKLPGIGPALAERIISYRSSHGGRFVSIAQIKEVPGVGPTLYKKLQELVEL